MELLFGFCTYEVQLGTITVILCSNGVYPVVTIRYYERTMELREEGF